jgi:hypothetical protein
VAIIYSANNQGTKRCFGLNIDARGAERPPVEMRRLGLPRAPTRGRPRQGEREAAESLPPGSEPRVVGGGHGGTIAAWA